MGGKIGFGEIALIFVAILLLFGAKRVPELAKSLGKSIGEFKKGREEGTKGLSDNDSTADSSKTNKA
jgi:sec-independent protein translocase protein TatA